MAVAGSAEVSRPKAAYRDKGACRAPTSARPADEQGDGASCNANGERARAMGIVCAVGVESAGKTTLCQHLARTFGVPWLPEYAREHLDGSPYDEQVVAAIARDQMRREAALLASGARRVVLDTDLAVIWVWWRVKFGPPPGWLEQALRAQPARLYLLCRPDLPWQPDPLRESRGERWPIHRRYRCLLSSWQLPFAEVGGRGAARMDAAVAAAGPLLAAAGPDAGAARRRDGGRRTGP